MMKKSWTRSNPLKYIEKRFGSPKQRRFILHIGRYKTGSSALQKWLAAHGEQLSEKGFLYPVRGRLEEWPFAHHVAAKKFIETGRLPATLIDEISSTEDSIILSCEYFEEAALSQNDDWDELVKLAGDFKVEIVMFVRQPSKWIESFYREKVMRGELDRQIQNFSSFLRRQSDYLSTQSLVEPWQRHFPDAKFHFISYEYALQHGGVVEAFLSVTGLSAIVASTETDSENVSLPTAYLKFLREVRPQFENDMNAYNEILGAIWRLKARLDTDPGPFLERSAQDLEKLEAADAEYMQFLLKNRVPFQKK